MKHSIKPDPEIAALLDDEMKYQKATSREYRRVKIPVGHSWLLRFIPVEVDPVKKLPFLRVAQHWINNKPFLCMRNSSASIGGNLETVCPLCDVAERFVDSSHEEQQALARKAQGNPRYLTYVLVQAMDDGRKTDNSIVEIAPPDLYLPYEFSMPKGSFTEWLSYFRRETGRVKPWGICDWKRGSSIWFTMDNRRRMALTKEDSGPFIETDSPEKFLKITAKILDQIKVPTFTAPARGVLEVEADKLEDALRAFSGSSGRRSPRPAQSDDNDDADTPTPSRTRRAPVAENDDTGVEADDEETASASRRRPSTRDEAFDEEDTPKPRKPLAEEDDDLDYSHPDKPSSASAATRAKPAPTEDEDNSDETQGDDADADGEDDEATPPVKKRELAKAPSRKPRAVTEEDDVADETEDPAPAKRKPVDPSDDEDNAPPVRSRKGPAPIADESEDDDTLGAPDDDDPPTPVKAQGALDAAIRKRTSKLDR